MRVSSGLAAAWITVALAFIEAVILAIMLNQPEQFWEVSFVTAASVMVTVSAGNVRPRMTSRAHEYGLAGLVVAIVLFMLLVVLLGKGPPGESSAWFWAQIATVGALGLPSYGLRAYIDETR